MQTDLKRKTLERLDGMTLEEWLSFMMYFAPKMIEEEGLLFDIVCRRAEMISDEFNKQQEKLGGTSRKRPADDLPPLMASLGLRLVVG